MIDPRYCDWCGEPVVKGEELCVKCLHAQKQVEAGQLVPATTPKPLPPTVMQQVGSGLLIVAKAMLAMIAGGFMLVFGLMGTCATIGLMYSLGNLGSFLGLAVTALIFFGLTFAFYRGIMAMYYKPPKRINQQPTTIPPRNPPLLHDHLDDDDYFPLSEQKTVEPSSDNPTPDAARPSTPGTSKPVQESDPKSETDENKGANEPGPTA